MIVQRVSVFVLLCGAALFFALGAVAGAGIVGTVRIGFDWCAASATGFAIAMMILVVWRLRMASD